MLLYTLATDFITVTFMRLRCTFLMTSAYSE